MTDPAVSPPPVRWGILGTGSIARTFTEDLLTLPGHVVAAVGSRSPGPAGAFAAEYQIERAHGGYGELAADDSIDVVYVATPQSRHLPDALLCLNAGRAVLVEKPLAMTAEQAAELLAQAKTAGRFAMEAMWMRFNPVIREVLRLIADGAIGDVREVAADFSLDLTSDPENRLWRPELGGGALLDLGIYPVTLATLVLGPPDRVAAGSVAAPTGVDARTSIELGYPSGAAARLWCGLTEASPCTATITGTRGQIELDAPFFRPSQLTLSRAAGGPQVIALPWAGHGYTYEADEVAACLRAGLLESPLLPHAATMEVMRLLDRVRGCFA